ncbi:MAG: large conductance mechanosensitive channel protein MscL [Bacteroidetes bacterium]|nr:large conductance mechanosensitive channel protein MscL [Bacteroidota bacterium]
MWKEFKAFALTGNLLDIAVGFVMGGAFAAVSGAFTGGIVAPLVGMLTGGVDLSKIKTVLKPAEIGADGKEIAAEVALQWGVFITSIIDFLIIAFVMFLIIRGVNKMKKAEPAGPPPPPPADIVLLTEIRDLLKK